MDEEIGKLAMFGLVVIAGLGTVLAFGVWRMTGSEAAGFLIWVVAWGLGLYRMGEDERR